MNYQGLLGLLIIQLSRRRKTRDIFLKDGERIPGQARISNCGLLSPLEPLQGHQRAGETSKHNHRARHSCWVQGTVTYAR